MNVWSNLIGYQLVWFCAVIGAGQGLAWPGVAAALVFAAWQLGVSRHPRMEWRLIAVGLLLGLSLDGAQAQSGLLTYAAPWPWASASGAPAWILALWVAFSLTFTQSLAFLQARPWLAAAIGAIGCPLAYLGAARGWQAVAFAPPAWRALLWLAVAWGVAIPLLALLARRWSRAAQPRPPRLHGAAS